MGEMISRIREMSSEDCAYERARKLAHQAVAMEKIDRSYTGAAIVSLSRTGNFGSWLKKLYHGERVTIHLHFYERLVAIVEMKADEIRSRADHVKQLAEKSRMNASTSSGEGSGSGMAAA